MRRARVIVLGGALAAALALVPAAPPADATVVCVPMLAGSRCVQFLEGRPTKPGLTDGMEITIEPTELTDTNELVVDIAGFRPGEAVRRFNYSVFGPKRMNEYSGNFRRADGKGRFHWVVAPSTVLYKRSWGRPALCVQGMRSRRLACAEFTIETEPQAAPAATSQQSGSGSSSGSSDFGVPVAS
jgi:hypothetical protein